MTLMNSPEHVYHRVIDSGERNSLSVLAGLIRPDSNVLDLGTGSGALGLYLRNSLGCTVDGLTYNEDEARIAAPGYRQLVVADLERCDLEALFGGQRYDSIVCADVLEHIRQPENVLRQCRQMLAPGGQLLISVPNAAYSGLVGELMDGEFLYRQEGLLDATHVRFFTRRSLLRFLGEGGWQLRAMETIERALNESEFGLRFDKLPPAVARHLLSRPDALTYQFIAVAQPGEQAQSLEAQAATATAGQAVFAAQLFLGTASGYSEQRRLIQAGVIGQEKQTLVFNLPEDGLPLERLRLDPADRPGYLHLYRIALQSQGTVLWQWRHDDLDAHLLADSASQQMLFRPPVAAASAALVLLFGDDPWVELPIPIELLLGTDLRLEVELGWPMSADYQALADTVAPLAQSPAQLRQAQQEIASLQTVRAQLVRQSAEAEERHRQSLLSMESMVSLVQQEKNQTLEQARGECAHALEQLNLESSQALERAKQEKLQAVLVANQEKSEALAFERRLLAGHVERQKKLEQQVAIEHARKEALEQQVASEHVHKEALQAQLTGLRAENKLLADARDDVQARLSWIENSNLIRYTRPLIRVKMRLNRLFQSAATPQRQTQPGAVTQSRLKPNWMVDVVVPVYKGLEDTQRCIQSALRSQCAIPFRLVVINDASPDPEVSQWLREISAQDGRVLLLENPENLGFVGTVNRGMSLSDSHDVVLLNSDTEVANNWLDRLSAAAYVSEKVGTVTPFSNNATICSYPAFCKENPMVEGLDTATLDQMFARLNPGQVVDIPTGVGFCMYIRRDCLSQVGLFDVANFGKGYGEENDFCRRAAAAGWRNLHALDTFVLHAGGVSFGASKNARVDAAMQTMARLYPDYDGVVQQFIASDPAAPARLRVDLERLHGLHKPVVLFVVHDRSGGTLRHVAELAIHLAGQASFLCLTPIPGDGVCLKWVDAHEGFALNFYLPEEQDALLGALRQLRVRHLHYQHLIGHSDLVLALPQLLGLGYDFTAHDYYTLCPQISLTGLSGQYCGEKGPAQCAQCLQAMPAPGGVDIATWREKHKAFLRGARHVYVPSQDAQARMCAFTGRTDILCVPHTDLQHHEVLPVPAPRLLEAGKPLKIAVIGALSKIKGADLLEDTAVEAARSHAPLEFHLVGYAYRHLKQAPDANLTVHGAYEEANLAGILADLQPDLVWFTALWPETYSYTLSACLDLGLPVVAPDLGAFAERLAARAWSWVEPWDRPALDWIAFFSQLQAAHFSTGIAPASRPKPASRNGEVQWHYQAAYLAGLGLVTPASDPGPDLELVQFHTGRPTRPVNMPVKHQTLETIVRLRQLPLLSSLVRAIPAGWQRRVKTWLQAR